MAKEYSEEITKRIKDAILAHNQYQLVLLGYGLAKGAENYLDMKKFKKRVNESVKDCNKKLPKSLIDKFEIKKIE